MNYASTYNKYFFLAGRNLTLSNIFSNISGEIKSNQASSVSEEVASSKKAFNLTKNIVWVCSKCGHTHIGSNSPDSCPICNSSYIINDN